MARWTVTISGKGVRKDTVQKLADSLREKYGEGASITVTDATPPESRGDRFASAQGDVSQAQLEFESLRDELQEWYDNLPETFQGGDKGSQLEEAISSLEELIDACDSIGGTEVSFPGMY